MNAQGSSVLLLAYAYPPENTSGAARPYRFAKYLPEFGHSTHVIAAGFYSEPEPPRNLLRLSDELLFWEKVVRHFLLPGELGLSWIPRVLASAPPIIKRNEIRNVISTSPPPTTHIAALLLKRRYGLRWIADFRDPLVGNPFRAHSWAMPKIDSIVESIIFRHADVVIAVTDAIAEEWKHRYPQYAHKINVIYNGYDPHNMFLPGPPPARKHRLMAHVGSLYGGRRPTLVLAAMDRLLARGEIAPGSIRVRLVGFLNEGVMGGYEDLWHRLKAAGLLEWSGEHVPHSEAEHEMAEADSLLLIDLNTRGVGHTLPAKIFEYVLCGRPILALTEPASPVERTLAVSGIPFVCIYSGDSETDIDKKFKRFLEIPAIHTKPSRYFLEQFDGRMQTEMLAGLLAPSLSSESPAGTPVHSW